MTICFPQISVRRWATTRAMRSFDAPGAKPTIHRIDFAGKIEAASRVSAAMPAVAKYNDSAIHASFSFGVQRGPKIAQAGAGHPQADEIPQGCRSSPSPFAQGATIIFKGGTPMQHMLQIYTGDAALGGSHLFETDDLDAAIEIAARIAAARMGAAVEVRPVVEP